MRLLALAAAAMAISQDPPATPPDKLVQIDARIVLAGVDLRGETAKVGSPWDQVGEPAGAAPEKLAELLKQLAAEEVGSRDAAAQAIERLGPDVLPHLKKALSGASKEVSGRLTAIASRHHPKAEPRARWTAMGRDAATEFLKDLRTNRDVTLTSSSRLLANPGQEASLLVGEQISYVRGYEIEVGPESASATPVIDVATTGVHVTFKASPKGKGDVAISDLVLEMSARRDPTVPLKVVATPAGAVEDPEIQTLRYGVSALCADGGAVLVGPLRRPWSRPEDPQAWVVLRVVLVELDSVREK